MAQAFSTWPLLSALAETHRRLTCPLGSLTRTRCTFGLKVRRLILAMWVPMPPLFLVRPLRWIRLPLTRRLPVTEQIRAIAFSLIGKTLEATLERGGCKD